MKFLCEKLLCDFYKTDAVSLAKALLGKLLVTDTGGKITAGIITETEAYWVRRTELATPSADGGLPETSPCTFPAVTPMCT